MHWASQPVRQASALTHESGHVSPRIVNHVTDSHKFTWTEAVGRAPNRPLWRLLCACRVNMLKTTKTAIESGSITCHKRKPLELAEMEFIYSLPDALLGAQTNSIKALNAERSEYE